MHAPLEFGLLGPLEAYHAGELVPVSAPKLRVVLATLLLRANQDVSLRELADTVWGSEGPARPRAALRVFLMRVRQLFDADLIRTMPDGYRLEIADEAVDLCRFNSLVDQGMSLSAEGELERAEELLDRAMGLWRAEALADVPSEALQLEAARLEELRLRAEHLRFEVKLRRGLHHDVIGPLRELTAENPLREDLWAHLLLALYRADRQAEALAAYQEISVNLARELQVFPGQALRELHQSILVGDPAIASPHTSSARSAAVVSEPPRAGSQLPPAIRNFVGRRAETERIVALLKSEGEVPVVTVSGPPGVGKTALAVRVAHRMRTAFPDGQFYVDLHTHSMARRPSTPMVLARLLRALGHSAEHMPMDQDELVAAYRTALRGRRVLITADNVGATSQVRPLIPSEPGCAIVVTSRNELTALTARDGARGIRLDMLAERESVSLLGAVLGEDVTARQAEATARLADLCGHLPLALRIAASNLAGSHRPDIGAYIERFLEGRRVQALAMDDDQHIAVSRAFDLSYVALPSEARALFRLLALFPGADITGEATAVLADVAPPEAAKALEQLAAANLVQRLPGDRYQLHDLLSEYAAERARTEDLAGYRAEARDRLFDWYLRGVKRAAAVLYPELVAATRSRSEAEPAVGPAAAHERSEALHWLETERANLIAVIEFCAEQGPGPMAWQLAEAMGWYLGISGHHSEYVAAASAGLRAARSAGDPAAESAMVGCLVWEYRNLGDLDTALRYLTEVLQTSGPDSSGRTLLTVWHGSVRLELGHLERARACFVEVADLVSGQTAPSFLSVAASLGLGAVDFWAGHCEQALPRMEEALAAASRGGATVERVECLMVLGRCLLEMGRTERAADLLRTAAEESSALRNGYHQADCFAHLALALAELGDLDAASEAAHRARNRSRDLHNRCITATVWQALGAVHRARGEGGKAVEAYRQALAATTQGTVHPYRMCESLLGLARAHTVLGRPREAAEHARLARDTAREYGFGSLEARARQLLMDGEPAPRRASAHLPPG
ncbi:AfsR/SARP family transcriptional regulator [Streptomyces sp. ME19-01-6]|uniref:AfsR/SARP family transcriptional regulator n=1 Tax=Streptomyces sp. ME19-01-6 TaxID=3028686 RepID=UPI0029A2AC38|nr:BTAD domain-containing putative transcriptional regulator [Streptomyces sp. ME19-01-6]MDX3232394.1 BTAD domain-containing putative transcriptional regulator [Streptomyces sp. ME19-01-6]